MTIQNDLERPSDDNCHLFCLVSPSLYQACPKHLDLLATLVLPEHEMGYQMRRIMEAAGQPMPEVKPILELNPSHALVTRLEAAAREGLLTAARAAPACTGLGRRRRKANSANFPGTIGFGSA